MVWSSRLKERLEHCCNILLPCVNMCPLEYFECVVLDLLFLESSGCQLRSFFICCFVLHLWHWSSIVVVKDLSSRRRVVTPMGDRELVSGAAESVSLSPTT